MIFSELNVGDYFRVPYMESAYYRKCITCESVNAIYIEPDGLFGCASVSPTLEVHPCEKDGEPPLVSANEIKVGQYFTDSNNITIWYKSTNCVLCINRNNIFLSSVGPTDKYKRFRVVKKPSWAKLPD